MLRTITVFLLGIPVLCAPLHAADKKPFKLKIKIRFIAKPKKYKGPCPGKIRFFGQITQNRAGPLKYRFIRSDGAQSRVYQLAYPGPGTRSITSSWVVNKPDTGWMQIAVLSPAKTVSRKVNFVVDCKPRPVKKPYIKSLQFKGKCFSGNRVLAVKGMGFGKKQGNRNLVLDAKNSHLHFKILKWSPELIKARLLKSSKPVAGTKYRVIIEGAKRGKWESNTNRVLTVCPRTRQ